MSPRSDDLDLDRSRELSVDLDKMESMSVPDRSNPVDQSKNELLQRIMDPGSVCGRNAEPQNPQPPLVLPPPHVGRRQRQILHLRLFYEICADSHSTDVHCHFPVLSK